MTQDITLTAASINIALLYDSLGFTHQSMTALSRLQ